VLRLMELHREATLRVQQLSTPAQAPRAVRALFHQPAAAASAGGAGEGASGAAGAAGAGGAGGGGGGGSGGAAGARGCGAHPGCLLEQLARCVPGRSDGLGLSAPVAQRQALDRRPAPPHFTARLLETTTETSPALPLPPPSATSRAASSTAWICAPLAAAARWRRSSGWASAPSAAAAAARWRRPS
jgi:hypothetical protein